VGFDAGSQLRCIGDFAFCETPSLKSICRPATVQDLTGLAFDFVNSCTLVMIFWLRVKTML
jgi:hypothetical protein